MAGRGDTLPEQIRDAVARAALDSRFDGPVVASEINDLTIELWFQTAAYPIPLELRGDPEVIGPGIDGLEVELDTAFAYYKPSVALTSRVRSVAELFAKLCRKAGLDENAWLDARCELRRTSWIHYSEAPDGTEVKLVALRRTGTSESDEVIMRRWAEAGARYLANNQDARGWYTYIYRPLQGESVTRTINVVRAAGCTYAMAWMASIETRPALRDRWRRSAGRSAAALLERAVPFGNGLIIREEDRSGQLWGKLGAVALLAVALSFPSVHEDFVDAYRGLMTTIRDAQASDGMFRCRLGIADDKPGEIDFYPGEALLALALAAERGDDAALAICRRSFAPYRQHFRDTPRSAFILWQVDVWWRLAILEHESAFAEFVFEMVDWILQFQLGPETSPLYRGGFMMGRTAPGASTCTYAEAVVRGAKLAHLLGDRERALRYRQAASAAMGFCARLVIGEEQRPFLADPARAIGGVTRNLASFDVRCDQVQHLMTLALASLAEPSLFWADSGGGLDSTAT